MTNVNKELNRLLWHWGQTRFTEYLGYPRVCSYLQEYTPRGYKNNGPIHDPEETEELGKIINEYLDQGQTLALLCRFRLKLNKRMSANRMCCSVEAYTSHFRSAIKRLEAILC